MNSSPQTVALGDVLHEDRKRIGVEPGRQYRIAGVLIAGQGLFWTETIDGSATKYATLYRLRAGQLVYRKLTAWEGPITVVPEEFDGAYVSAEFPTFTLDESRLLMEFLRCICQQPSFHDEMRMRSTGTAERRNRLAPDALLDIEVDLPPPEEQGAIADLARTFESHQRRAACAARAAQGLLVAAREHLLQQIVENEPLDTVVRRFEAGSSPKCLDRPRGPPGSLRSEPLRATVASGRAARGDPRRTQSARTSCSSNSWPLTRGSAAHNSTRPASPGPPTSAQRGIDHSPKCGACLDWGRNFVTIVTNSWMCVPRPRRQ